MATQYNAGLTSGQVLTAATMNSIGATWETWTPTVTALAGTITAGTISLARYMQIQKLVIATFNYSITTAGTAVGSLVRFTLPITASTTVFDGMAIGNGREYGAVGYGLVGFKLGTTCTISNMAGAGWITSGHACSVTVVYEAA